MEQPNLIPINKNDEYTLSLLKQAEGPQILAVAAELLEWLADINWPIAGPLADILCPYVNQLKAQLLPVLKGNDCEWKCWCIKLLIVHNEAIDYIDEELLAELRRLVTVPTPMEQWDELQEEAQQALARWDQPTPQRPQDAE
jgi:hypothetical protein